MTHKNTASFSYSNFSIRKLKKSNLKEVITLTTNETTRKKYVHKFQSYYFLSIAGMSES